MRRAGLISVVFVAFAAACAPHRPAATGARAPHTNENRSDFGVLVMAHGGSPEWNAEVLAAVDPLRTRNTVAVAFGMADAVTIQESVRLLEEKGARRIAVVRVFISGDSWYDRTEQILGLRPGAPEPPMASHSHEAGHRMPSHSMQFWRIRTEASFALSLQGLANAPAMGSVLADRARALSRDPRKEQVLVLAHGVGDESENERWIASIDERAQNVRDALPFTNVHVMTLREDWPDKRADSERRIRAFVADAAGRQVATIVIPFRVQGFGPYKQVLDGLPYVADGRGLIPHADVTNWIAEQVATLQRGAFRPVAAQRDRR